jgi:hypothetical protein
VDYIGNGRAGGSSLPTTFETRSQARWLSAGGEGGKRNVTSDAT